MQKDTEKALQEYDHALRTSPDFKYFHILSRFSEWKQRALERNSFDVKGHLYDQEIFSITQATSGGRNLMASVQRDNGIFMIWDLDSKREIHRKTDLKSVTGMVASGDLKRILLGLRDGSLQLYSFNFKPKSTSCEP